MSALYIVNRQGEQVPVDFTEIKKRLELLACRTSEFRPELRNLDLTYLTGLASARFRNGMSTHDIDEETIRLCHTLSVTRYEYAQLAARIVISDLQKQAPESFSACTAKLAYHGKMKPDYLQFVAQNAQRLDEIVVPERDYIMDFAGVETMRRIYSLKTTDNRALETAQYTYLRVAINIVDPQYTGDFDAITALYDKLSFHKFTLATPIILTSGLQKYQLASCYLLGTDDEWKTLFETLSGAAYITRATGGVSVGLSKLRSCDSIIMGKRNGLSSGVPGYCELLQTAQNYSNYQTIRPSRIAVYLEMWHGDILSFIKLGRLSNVDAHNSIRCPDLKYALWIPDLFMQALEDELKDPKRGQWHLFNPLTAPGLDEVYDETPGGAFTQLYNRYVAEGRYIEVVKASFLIKEWFITLAQIGNPYICFKDHINRTSNMKNIATITHSNLCAEITIPSRFNKTNWDDGFDGVCILGSVNLENAVVESTFNFQHLYEATCELTVALNLAIDNYRPIRSQNLLCTKQARPIGIGVMGLANVFALLNIPFDTNRAVNLDMAIHAVLYYAAQRQSMLLAREKGPYQLIHGAPIEQGILQPDLSQHIGDEWEATVEKLTRGFVTPMMWKALREDCKRYGVYNAYVTALMPTSSSSFVNGVNECFEPFTATIYMRKTQNGEFIHLNKHLQAACGDAWTEDLVTEIINNAGSVQKTKLPFRIRRTFRTAREIDQIWVTKHAIARTPFVSQSMSLNYYYTKPILRDVLTNIMHGWRNGLTTGCYYTHFSPGGDTHSFCEACAI